MSAASVANRNEVYMGLELSRCQFLVADYVERAGRVGATRHEIAAALRMPLSGVCGRIAELERAGLVVSTAATRESQFGKPATVIVSAPGQLRQLDLFQSEQFSAALGDFA
jgi:hypothetical protein